MVAIGLTSFRTMSPRKSQKSQPTSAPSADVAWTITRLTGTPAKLIGLVYAPDEATALTRAIEQFKIPEAQRQKLAARAKQRHGHGPGGFGGPPQE